MDTEDEGAAAEEVDEVDVEEEEVEVWGSERGSERASAPAERKEESAEKNAQE